jgi:hypothetical protein
MHIRVPDQTNCSALIGCNYDNGGCQHTCTQIDPQSGTGAKDYRCSCDEGYRLSLDQHSCLADGSSQLGNIGSGKLVVNCDTNGFLCSHRCVRGNPDYCACPSGLQLTPNGLICTDIDECNSTTSVCPTSQCINTFGKYDCLTLKIGIEAQPASQIGADAAASGADAAEGGTSALSVTVIALVAWVVIMTLALVAIAVVVFRKWRDQRPTTGDTEDGASSESGRSESSGDMSDISSSYGGSRLGLDHSNLGFDPTGEDPSSVHVHSPSLSSLASFPGAGTKL